MSAEKKRQYLSAVDVALESSLFRRGKNGNEWRHTIDDRNELWIHINFGKAVLNPSLGVRYLDFDSLMPRDIRTVSGTMVVLRSLLSPNEIYLIDDGPGRVVQDLAETGLPFLWRLSNRAFAIERLASDTIGDWPAPSYSDRIRLLPLLLAAENRTDEACAFLKLFLVESSTRDQIIPRYDVFAKAFTEQLGC